ncbi:MAG: hypothetical protein HYX38_30020 [Rhodospirillales bacterium]|nr:hypothetical protein [Rhodospirillales bacterium]
MSKAACDESVAGRLLAARRAMRGTEWDGSDLDHFVQVLCRLDADRHGFGALDVLAIEDAWVATGETWTGGLVALLMNGRRAHVDGRAGQSHWAEEDSDIEAGLLDGAAQHPELDARHGWQGHARDDTMACRLNELLDRVAR